MEINIVDVIKQAYEAFDGNLWRVFIGCVIMGVVWISRLVLKDLEKSTLPIISIIFGTLYAIATGLMNGDSFFEVILYGFTLATSASGIWSLRKPIGRSIGLN